jgi:copper chaperone CopZ
MEKTFKIEGMNCRHCVEAVENNLSKLNLRKVQVEIGSVTVEFDEKILDEKVIIKSVENAGYRVIV